jgi:peptidoglycan/xylan/chitin deacetylase (PgdA/CDA1 family)
MKNTLSSPIILMYHGIVQEPSKGIAEGRDVGAEIYDLPLTKFREQLHWLKQSGFHVTTDVTRLGDPASTKPIIITFDDGEMNNYDLALPVLKELNMRAYFFILVGRVGQKGYLNWPKIKQMHEAGMIIGSHGLSHEILTNLLDTQIEEELRASKRTIERNLGIVVDSLSIPRGFCNDKIIRMAYDLGYKTVFVSEKPQQLRMPCYPRVAIKSHWSLERFKQAASGEIPSSEALGVLIRRGSKRLLGEGVYNKMRGWIIQLFR